MAEATRLVMALPEVEEVENQGKTAWAVEGKVFATLTTAIHMDLTLKTEDIYAAIEQNPGACTEFLNGGRPVALHVDLRRATPKALERLLRQAWQMKAPKRLLQTAGR